MAALEGTDWRLVAYAGGDGDLVDVPGGVAASARFEDGRLSGSSGCNRFVGPWSVTAEGLAIGALAGTLMACDGPTMEVEAAYLARLGEVTRAVTGKDGLDLLGADARVLLRFRASTQALAGVRWVATEINNGRGGVASLVAGTEVILELGEDGRVAGSAGCNRCTGSWSAKGEAFSIGPLATTRRLCPEPDGVMDQEAAFLAAMDRVATWRIDGDRLELRAADGALQAGFRAAGAAGDR